MEVTKPLAEIVTNQLIEYIISKQLSDGDKLPNEFELAKILNCGRSTVREAVKALVSRNILEVRQGSGTFVSKENFGIAADPLGFTFIQDKRKLTLDLLDIRITIEPRIAAMAAMHASEEEITEMRRLCMKVEAQILQGEDHMQSDIAFHTILAQSSKNLVVPNLMPIIQSAISLFVDTTNRKLKQETIMTHKMILQAIEVRDPVAASDATYMHILYNRMSIRDSLSNA